MGLVEDAPPKTYQNMAVRHRKKNSSLPPRDLKKLEALRSLAEVRVKLGHGDCWKPQKLLLFLRIPTRKKGDLSNLRVEVDDMGTQ